MPDNRVKPPTSEKIDLGTLAETITASVYSALDQRAAARRTPNESVNPRIIIGAILEGMTKRESDSSYEPIDSSDLASFTRLLSNERIERLKRSPERLALIQGLSTKLERDPLFMAVVERTLRNYTDDVDKVALTSFEPTTFGWDPSPDLPSPKKAAAAVAAAVAAMVAGPVPVPV